MIRSKKDYLYYLKADSFGEKGTVWTDRLLKFLFPDEIQKFKRLLRKAEYYKNVKKGFFNNIVYYITKYRFKKQSLKLGFTIPENVFGPGLSIPHYGTIIVNAKARVGANCRIHVSTNIGESGGVSGAPIIGDNVYIGPGAKIYGAIRIADNIAIAANAAVSRSFLNSNMMIGGVPARELKELDIKQIIKNALEPEGE
jgi:serine O-acetyltransferase